MALAAVSDVAARLGRPLTTEEQDLASVLLDVAEARLRLRIPDLDQRVGANPAYMTVVVDVLASSVVRVLKNPDGFRMEMDGSYQYQVDTRAAAGFLTFLDSELEDLGLSGAFAIDTVGAAGSRGPLHDRPDLWLQWHWPGTGPVDGGIR